ncbi:MAG TPA: 4Fe-4S binding protein [Dehalococcoidia bacterium]|nr:4Fe-4S binding protein [Dehalococcoidia bacterium]
MIGVLKALGVTFGTMLRKPVTIEYPTVHRPVPERDRAFPILLWDYEVDEPFCTGCHACERACPVECMTVTMKDNPKFAEGKSKRRKIVDQFFIDYGRCMRCNICVEVCNFDAIAMNNTWAGHELSTEDRKELVMDLEQLLAQHKTRDPGTRIKPWVPS